jgi:hypothetical protein
MTLSTHRFPQNASIVARPILGGDEADSYLRLTELGGADWTRDPRVATSFESMKEAMRAAARLPSSMRAFGLPLRSEISALAFS